MATRRHLLLATLAIFALTGASYQTQTRNFIVEAASPQVAQQVAQAAEQYRKEKAIEWIGQEMPPWSRPCPIKVSVTMGGAGGATSFAFDQGQVLDQRMHIEGSLDRLIASVLPHEVTHTVFAYYFRTPVPRWADEGGAVLSEDDVERNRHDMMCRQILNAPGRAIPLRRLFALREYPSDVMALYAEGYSVANFLVSQSNRQTFLAFVAHGMQQGWDGAAQSHYRYRSVEELEQAWLAHLRATKRPPAQVAQNNGLGDPGSRVLVRQTVPPAQPILSAPTPIVRGVSPDTDDSLTPFPRGQTAGQPTSFTDRGPVMMPTPARPPEDGWQPAGQTNPMPPVRLGLPQFGPAPMVAQPPRGVSPAGYPW